jgi:hypothetical protein
MTFEEFRALVRPLSILVGAEFDHPTWRLYHRALENVPMGLLARAVKRAAETRTKMPSAAQFRELAEQERQALLAANPYEGCADCEEQRGWVTRVDIASGQKTVQRCSCKARYDAKLAELGVTTPIAAPALPAGDFSRIGDDAA